MRDRASSLPSALAACLVLFLAAGVRAETLRIGLIRHFKAVAEVSISSTADFRITDSSGSPVAAAPAGERITLSAKDGAITLTRADGTSSTVGKEVEAAASSPDALIILSTPDCPSAQYRGRIAARAVERRISLVNVVDVEDYLCGVVPSEMPSGFKLEALKAQAVAARTYACANRGRHAEQGYDLCDSTHCQVYLGAAGERPSASQAVKETAGLVAIYRGRLISAQYCSDCGGTTQAGGTEYLASVIDRPEEGGADYCEHDGHSWTKTWPIADLEKLLQKSFPRLRGLRSLLVMETDASGRAIQVKIEADSGAETIMGSQLRDLLGRTSIKSTAFVVKIENGGVIFEGRGSGHGVGLCQFGANGLASPPHNCTFEQILKHYYRGVEVVPLSSLNH